MALSDKAQQLDEQIATAIRQALSTLREDVQRRLQQSSEEVCERLDGVAAELPASLEIGQQLGPLSAAAAEAESRQGFDALRQAFTALDAARTQNDLLSALLEQAGRYADRSALLLTREEGLVGWGGYGFGDAEQPLSSLELGYAPGSPWGRLAAGEGVIELSAADCAPVSSHLGSPLPHCAVLIPMVLRDRLAAALYADRLDADDPLAADPLQLLVYAAAQALEIQPMRRRATTSTLYRGRAEEAAAVAPLPLWGTAAEAPATAPPEAEEAERVAEPQAGEHDEAVAIAEPEPADGADLDETATSAAGAQAAPDTPDFDAATLAETPATAPGGTLQDSVTLESPALDTEPDDAAAAPELDGEPPAEEAADWDLSEAQVTIETETETETERWQPIDDEMLDVAELAPEEAATDPGTLESSPLPAEDLLEPEAPGDALPEASPQAPPQAPPQPPPSVLDTAVGDEALVEPVSQDETPFEEMSPPQIPPSTKEVPLESDEDETVLLSPRPIAVPPPPEVSEVPEVPDAPEAPEVSEPPEPDEEDTYDSAASAPRQPERGAQVVPPSGFSGPGLAFAGTESASEMPSDEAAAHEEGKRLARLLVSEIRLYNEEQVEEGRRNRDIYRRLREDIDRSRRMYEERVNPQVRAAHDYFQEELVRILADGDAEMMGM